MPRSFRFVLNERQLTLLRRIADGGEPVTSAEPHLAPTVYALRDRGLVEAKRRAGRWAATVTPAGRAFAATGIHPDEKLLPAPATVPRAPRLTPSVRAAREPPLDLVKATVSPPPVPVPARLFRPHRLVETAQTAALGERADETGRLRLRRDGGPSLKVSKAALPRALRILHALYTEAERRGYSLVAARGYDPGVALVCRGNALPVALWEETDKSPHEPTASELKDAARYSWRTAPTHNFKPSGRLRLEIPASYGTTSGRRRAWRDTTRCRVEAQLGDVFAELEVRADLAAIAREEREARERELALEAARARDMATTAFLRDAQRAALREQVQRWTLARTLRDAAADMTDRYNRQEEPDPATAAWTAAAFDYADELDPPDSTLRLPTPPTVTPQDLLPYFPARYGWRRPA